MAVRKLVSLDWAIKKILRSKANFGILEGFLSELLFEDIQILEILESESNKEYSLNKCNRVDIKIKNSKKEIVIIEIQFDSEYDYFQRILYATSKIISERLQEGNAFNQVVKVISINIIYFDLGHGADYIYHGKTHFLGLHDHQELQLSEKQKSLFNKNIPGDLYPEYYIIKVNQFDNIAKNTLDEWVYFLKNEEVRDDFKAKGLKEAYEKLAILSLDKNEREIYEEYEYERKCEVSLARTKNLDLQFAKEEGEKIGIEKGRVEAKLEIARNLIDILDNATISLKTGLDIDEIEKLRTK